MGDFSNAWTYYHRFKIFLNQLKIDCTPISNLQIVFQMMFKLSDACNGIITLIHIFFLFSIKCVHAYVKKKKSEGLKWQIWIRITMLVVKKNMIVRHISHQNTGGSIPYHELFLIFYYYIKLFMCWIWINFYSLFH